MIARLGGSVLVFEAIVIVLAIPVAINVAGAAPGPAIALGGLLAAFAVLTAAMLRRGRGWVAAGWAVQVLVIASAIIVPLMLVLGGMFALLWYGALRLAAETAGPGDVHSQGTGQAETTDGPGHDSPAARAEGDGQ